MTLMLVPPNKFAHPQHWYYWWLGAGDVSNDIVFVSLSRKSNL